MLEKMWFLRCAKQHRVDLGESFQTHIYLQNLASIQPRTSPLKFVGSRDSWANSATVARKRRRTLPTLFMGPARAKNTSLLFGHVKTWHNDAMMTQCPRRTCCLTGFSMICSNRHFKIGKPLISKNFDEIRLNLNYVELRWISNQ